jgi:hypothetical protein
MTCPACEQGVLIHVRIKPLNLEGFICGECEGFWEGNSLAEIDEYMGRGFLMRMEEKRLPATWDQLEIL